jgi:hypothetical protein
VPRPRFLGFTCRGRFIRRGGWVFLLMFVFEADVEIDWLDAFTPVKLNKARVLS